MQLCPGESASLPGFKETVTPVDLDHAQLSIFPNRTDPFFVTLLNELHNVLDEYSKEKTTSDTELDDVVSTLNLSLVSTPDIMDAFCKWSFQGGAGASLAVVQGQFPAGTLTYRPVAAALNSPRNVGTPGSGTKPTARLPCHIMTPHQDNPRFVGREDVLEEMDKQLYADRKTNTEPCVFALCGLGGMGKTQIALKYAFRGLAKFPVVLWVAADTYEKMLARYIQFAVELGLAESTNDDQNKARDAVKEWFETSGRLLAFSPLGLFSDNDVRGTLLDHIRQRR